MKTIDEYIASIKDPAVAKRLQQLRKLFHDNVPGTTESIRYNMPAFSIGRHHLYFAGYKQHIGFYPVGAHSGFEADITPYRGKGTKDSLHFRHEAPLPVDLIAKIIRWKAGQ